ncbi:MAG TPA: hypothetical protein VFZ44_14800 [Pyrinomonadaceae bacterium]
MKRTMFRLSVALLTFVAGVVAATLHLASQVPHVPTPVFKRVEMQSAPEVAHCFPGRSRWAQTMGHHLSYFPQGAFSTNEWGDKFRADWYSEHLSAMKEKPFYYPDNSEAESYRFLWLRSFHRPVAVRVWSVGCERFVTLKEMSGAGGYEPGQLLVDRTRKLSQDEWDEFTRLLEQTCYWELPTTDERLGNDGAHWILEGVRAGRYHVVDRWTPEGGSYREACLYALKLSGLSFSVSHEDVY